jgi:ADP-ribose pyrophosphatase
MMERRGTCRESRTAFKGRIFEVHVDRVALPNGREVAMEIVRHPRSVVLLPMIDADHVVLVRQYRYAIDRWIWELPAGSLESGENPVDAARRECHEEVGLVPGHLTHVATYCPTPGYCDEEMLFFRLEALARPAEPAAQDEDEHLVPKVFSLAEARGLVAKGEILDMKTVAGLALL